MPGPAHGVKVEVRPVAETCPIMEQGQLNPNSLFSARA